MYIYIYIYIHKYINHKPGLLPAAFHPRAPRLRDAAGCFEHAAGLHRCDPGSCCLRGRGAGGEEGEPLALKSPRNMGDLNGLMVVKWWINSGKWEI